MKAAVQHRYGSPDVVTIDEMPTPVPRADEVLIRVHAATAGIVDSLARRGTPAYARLHFGLRRPRFAVLGSDFAGQIEAIGPAVTRFAAGDPVFGAMAPRFGAHAEYACLSERAALAPKPANVTYAEAAALADTTAMCFLREKANLRPGQTILINGASGAVGTAAVQLARHFGATVTGVCGGASTGLVRKLGAGTVIDYTESDFTRAGASLRCDLRRGWHQLVHPLPRCAQPGRDLPHDRPLAGDPAPDAVDIEVRDQESGSRLHRAAGS